MNRFGSTCCWGSLTFLTSVRSFLLLLGAADSSASSLIGPPASPSDQSDVSAFVRRTHILSRFPSDVFFLRATFSCERTWSVLPAVSAPHGGIEPVAWLSKWNLQRVQRVFFLHQRVSRPQKDAVMAGRRAEGNKNTRHFRFHTDSGFFTK